MTEETGLGRRVIQTQLRLLSQAVLPWLAFPPSLPHPQQVPRGPLGTGQSSDTWEVEEPENQEFKDFLSYVVS